MEGINNDEERFEDLRRKAEEQLAERETQIERLEPADLKSLAHDLAVHQVELEIQNEELRRTRAEAEGAWGRYLDLFDFAPVGYFTLDEHNRIVEANLTGCQLLKMDRSNLLKKSFTKFIHPEETQRFYLHRKEVLENDTKQAFELKMQKADDTSFYAQLDSLKAGKERLRVAVSDITERKKAEEKLKEDRQRLASIIEGTNVGTWEWNVQTGQTIFNDIWAQIVGYTLDELAPISIKTWEALTNPDDLKRSNEMLERHFSGELPDYECECRMKHKDGHWVWVQDRGRVVTRTADGKPLMMFGIRSNISERKQIESRQLLTAEILGILNDSSKIDNSINSILTLIQRETGIEAVGIRLRSGDDYPYFAHNGFTNGFLVTENTLTVDDDNGDACRDKDGNVSLECTCGLVLSGKTDPVNPLFTSGGSAWTNDSFPILDLPADQDPRLHPRNRCIHEGFQSIALIPIRANRDIVGLLQLNDCRKNCFTLGMIHFFEGLTASIGVALMRKQAEEALQRYSAELETANKELKAFSYSVSHDLKAPLRRLGGFAQAVLEDYADKLDEKGREYLSHIRVSSQLMSQLIDDMLRLYRVTSTELAYDKLDLSDLVDQVATRLRNTSPGRKVEFIIQPGVEVTGDRQLLRQAIENLLDNTFKFTGKVPQARIEFGITDYQGKPTYFVKDNGAGFSMTHADKLFTPFQRLHSASDFPGTGIGLSIVQRIIHRHGGRIWAEGKIGKGATFYFTLNRESK